MRKALRFVALSLTGVVLLAAIAGGSALWFVSRSAPMTAGNLELKALEAPAKVYRDSWGIPHIDAQNEHDLFLAQGYVTAQDRLFQMDMSRRLASGRLSEVLGSTQIDSDRFFRTVGLQRAAEASLSQYSGATRAAAEAYAAGVNAYMNDAIRYHLLPWEFSVLHYKPEPWTVVDSLAILKYWAYDTSGHWAAQLFRYQLVEKVGQKRAVELFPAYPANATTIIDTLPPASSALDDSEVDHLLAFAPEANLGSNNWVVSGNKTATGKPFLANDPHLSLQTPAVWYEVQLSAGPYDVIGVNFPGVPGVLLGHNARIAWGATTLGADAQDLYVEQPNPTDPHKFLYKEQWETAKVIPETIMIRGESSETLNVLVTRHGPVISPRIPREDFSPQLTFSLRWTGLDPSKELDGLLAIDRAANWDEFTAALANFSSPTENWLYADVAGNIGYRASGKIPARKADNALLPVPGWTGENEWQGFIPEKDLPESYNPKSGYIATANNKVTGSEYPYHITDEWATPWRATRLDNQLNNARSLTMTDLQGLQTDFTDLEAERYAALLLDACRQATGGKWTDLEADARTVLGEWDYVARPDSPGAAIWNEWRLQLLEEILRPAMGAPLFQRFLETGSPGSALENLLDGYLRGETSAWLDSGKDSMRSLPQLAEGSFRRAAELVSARQSTNIDAWHWGNAHQAQFAHPLARQLPYLKRILDRGCFPIGGDAATVNATNYSLTAPFNVTSTATWRQVVDLGDLSRSVDILAPGESSHLLSPYYLNALLPWLHGTYHPQLFYDEDVKVGALLNLLPHL